MESVHGASFWLYILIIVGLVLFAGLMSGLTLGLMSLGLVDLEVLMKSGTPKDRKHAEKILPVVKNQHLLLCTLLLGNALAMEALPIFLDALVSPWGAILISVTLILMFGEIIPQSICSRYGLTVGATMAPVVRVLVFALFPITYPISKLLDFLLGKGHVALFRRAELKTLVDMHGNEAGKGGELTHDETTIIAGALGLTEKVAKDAMTPISQTFCIDVNAKLDMKTINLIMSKGHSRVPVYSGSPTNIIGLILVKNLLAIRPEDEVLVRNVTIRKIPRVGEAIPLYDILNEFQKGHSHMAAVVKYSKDKHDPENRSKDSKALLERRLSHRPLAAKSSGETDIPVDEAMHSMPGSGSFTSLSQASYTGAGCLVIKGEGDGRTAENGQSVSRGKKWERAKMQHILEISEESVPSFPQDEEVVGIITMEDLIEELLQEEILDETDEYIDVHNKIQVNMLPSSERSPISASSSSFPTATASPLSSIQPTPPITSPVISFQQIPSLPSMSPNLQTPRTTPVISTPQMKSGPSSPEGGPSEPR